jgi:hypothetical protein
MQHDRVDSATLRNAWNVDFGFIMPDLRPRSGESTLKIRTLALARPTVGSTGSESKFYV